MPLPPPIDVELHAFERCSDLDRIQRLGLFRRGRKHPHLVHGAGIEQAEVILRPQRLFESVCRRIAEIRNTLGDLEHLMIEVCLLDRGGTAGAARIVGVPVHLQSGVGTGFEEQRKILPPIAGDDAVSTRRLDLRNVRCEVGDLQQRMQFVADDLNVRSLRLQHGFCG